MKSSINRWIWIGAVVGLLGIVLVIFLFWKVESSSIKHALVLGDNGWEIRYVRASALPPDWDDSFEMVCYIPAAIISREFPEFSSPGSPMRTQLAPFRNDIDGVEAYSVQIELKHFRKTKTWGSYVVAMPSCDDRPDEYIYCSLVLASHGPIRVPELEDSDIVYISRKVLRQAVARRTGK